MQLGKGESKIRKPGRDVLLAPGDGIRHDIETLVASCDQVWGEARRHPATAAADLEHRFPRPEARDIHEVAKKLLTRGDKILCTGAPNLKSQVVRWKRYLGLEKSLNFRDSREPRPANHVHTLP